jgi:hypothetical protein
MEFLTFLIRGLPLVGGLVGKGLDAFSNYTNKKMDTELGKVTVNGKVDTDIIVARAQLAAQMKDDPATKYGRWFFIVPTGLFYVGCVWDSTGILRSFYKLGMLELPGWIQYMPYAVVAYLFVTAWRGNGNR